MKLHIMIRYFASTALVSLFFFTNAKAQLTLGVGFSGMKYYAGANERPLAVGFNGNLGIEFSPKTRVVLEPTFFFPVTYSYNQTLNTGNVPSVKTAETFSTTEAAALFQFDLIGNNKGGGVLYLAAGPSVMLYNTSVTRQNVANYDYSGSFHDYMFDARAGLEIPFLVFLKLYAEVEIEPKIATDFKSNNVSYTPNASSVMAATIGLRVHI
jgi:hypothetical protein